MLRTNSTPDFNECPGTVRRTYLSSNFHWLFQMALGSFYCPTPDPQSTFMFQIVLWFPWEAVWTPEFSGGYIVSLAVLRALWSIWTTLTPSECQLLVVSTYLLFLAFRAHNDCPKIFFIVLSSPWWFWSLCLSCMLLRYSCWCWMSPNAQSTLWLSWIISDALVPLWAFCTPGSAGVSRNY